MGYDTTPTIRKAALRFRLRLKLRAPPCASDSSGPLFFQGPLRLQTHNAHMALLAGWLAACLPAITGHLAWA